MKEKDSNTFKKFFIIIIAAFIVAVAVICGIRVSDNLCKYTISDGVLTTINSGSIAIIPDEVTKIDLDYTESKKDIEYLIIPDSVKEIAESSFDYCKSLKSVKLSSGVESIGSDNFCCCPNLKKIEVSKYNKKYDSRNNCNAVIETQSNKLIIGCSETVIPDSVTEIGDSAFSECTNLTQIDLNNVSKIGSCAFYNCSKLQSIDLAGVTEIGNSSFYNCNGLQKILLPEGIQKVGSAAFAYCTNLSKVTILNKKADICINTFDRCNNLSLDSLYTYDPLYKELKSKTDELVETHTPNVYHYELGHAGNLGFEPDIFTATAFRIIPKLNYNPTAVFNWLKNSEYFIRKKTDSTKDRIIINGYDELEESPFASIEKVKSAANTTQPYTHDGCQQALKSILNQVETFRETLSGKVPDVYYSAKDNCYYSYIFLTNSETYTHVLDIYFRSSNGKYIDDIAFEYIPVRCYAGGAAGCSLSDIIYTNIHISDGICLAAAAESYLTGKNEFSSYYTRSDDTDYNISIPTSRTVNGYSARMTFEEYCDYQYDVSDLTGIDLITYRIKKR